ncbi:unnamed protein product [Trichobilharzia regenti]|nr:unnamed protein product [Trichobilharzia regenti]
MQFVQEKRVTVSEGSSDCTSLQGITSQSEGIKPLRIYEEEPKSSTAVIKDFENDEVDQRDGGKVNICKNDHDSAHLPMVDRDEMSGMLTTTELNKGSVQLDCEIELKSDAVAEGMNTRETFSVNDQRVAHLSIDVKAEMELIIKDSSGGNLAAKQPPKIQLTTVSHAPLSSSTYVTQSSLMLTSTMEGTCMNSRVLCYGYASISPFERTNVNGQFSEGDC